MAPSVGRSSPAISLSSVVLPEPDGPEQRDQLARADVERNVVQRRKAVELLAHVDDANFHSGFLWGAGCGNFGNQWPRLAAISSP